MTELSGRCRNPFRDRVKSLSKWKPADVVEIFTEEMFDLAVVAAGDRAAYAEALGRLKPGGRLVVFSGLGKEQNLLPADFNRIHYLQQTIIGAYGSCYRPVRINLRRSGSSLLTCSFMMRSAAS